MQLSPCIKSEIDKKIALDLISRIVFHILKQSLARQTTIKTSRKPSQKAKNIHHTGADTLERCKYPSVQINTQSNLNPRAVYHFYFSARIQSENHGQNLNIIFFQYLCIHLPSLLTRLHFIISNRF